MYERPYYYDPFQNRQNGNVPPSGGQNGQQTTGGTQPPYQNNGAWQGQQPNGGYAYHPYGGQYQQPPQPPYQQYAPGQQWAQYPHYGYQQAPVLDEETMKKFRMATQEKQQLAQMGNLAGAFILLLFLFAFLFSFVQQAVMAGGDFTNSSLMENGTYIFYSIFCVGLPAFCATLKLRKDAQRPILPTKKVPLWNGVVYVVVGFALCMLANVVVSVLMSFLSVFGIEVALNNGASDHTWFELLLSLVATALIPAVVEECSFRGAFLQPLRKHGDGTAVLIVALLFGLFHGNLQQIPFAFLVGLVLGFVTVKTNSILPAMAIHFGNNAYSVLLSYLADNTSININVVHYAVLGVFGVAAIVLVLLSYLQGKESMFRLMPSHVAWESNPYALTTGQKMKAFFTAPCMIIGLVGIALEVIVTTRLTWFS